MKLAPGDWVVMKLKCVLISIWQNEYCDGCVNLEIYTYGMRVISNLRLHIMYPLQTAKAATIISSEWPA